MQLVMPLHMLMLRHVELCLGYIREKEKRPEVSVEQKWLEQVQLSDSLSVKTPLKTCVDSSNSRNSSVVTINSTEQEDGATEKVQQKGHQHFILWSTQAGTDEGKTKYFSAGHFCVDK